MLKKKTDLSKRDNIIGTILLVLLISILSIFTIVILQSTNDAKGVSEKISNSVNDDNYTANNNYIDKDMIEKVEDADYYVAPNGDDNNPGTKNEPWKTWQKAFSEAEPGQLIYIRGGIYTPESTYKSGIYSGVYISGKSGTDKNPIKIYAYPGEVPILDASKIIEEGIHSGITLEDSDWWHLKGLSIRNVRASKAVTWSAIGISIQDSNNIIIENTASYGNSGPGFAIKGNNNLFLNSDSYNNYDELTFGEHADGFILGHDDERNTNTFRGCRSFNNSDDGFDTYGYEGTAIYENSWAFNNGYGAEGDGAGFKLGKADQQALGSPQKILRNCIAANSKGDGFTQSETLYGTVEIYNSVAYNMGSNGFIFNGGGNVESVFKDNIAYKNKYPDLFQSRNLLSGNSWQMEPLNDDDFVSLDVKQMFMPRKKDGSLPDITFMNLKK